MSSAGEERDGVALTNLDQPLFDGAGATKRDLVDYVDAMSDRLVRVLRDRPLSVVRVHRGQDAFMQKNLPKYAPEWIERVSWWAETSRRNVAYALANDRRTLLWFANQRAVEFHPTLVRAGAPDRVTHLVLDLDPPEGAPFALVVAVAGAVRGVLGGAGLEGVVKTSGAKGVHVYVPVDASMAIDACASAQRALAARVVAAVPDAATDAFMKEDRHGLVFVDATRAGGATVVAAYSPRIRPGTPVSFPVSWDELDAIDPREFTIHSAPSLLGSADPWTDLMPEPQVLPHDLVEEGRAIPTARVEAMHEGKRRARARRTQG
jgi:bifunctional non-homologous end joining protein LigD